MYFRRIYACVLAVTCVQDHFASSPHSLKQCHKEFRQSLSLCRGTFASIAAPWWHEYDSVVTCCHLFLSITRFFDCEWLDPLVGKFLSTDLRHKRVEPFETRILNDPLMTLMLQRVKWTWSAASCRLGPVIRKISYRIHIFHHFSTSEMSWRIEGFDLTTWKTQWFIISFW